MALQAADALDSTLRFIPQQLLAPLKLPLYVSKATEKPGLWAQTSLARVACGIAWQSKPCRYFPASLPCTLGIPRLRIAASSTLISHHRALTIHNIWTVVRVTHLSTIFRNTTFIRETIDLDFHPPSGPCTNTQALERSRTLYKQNRELDFH